MNTHAEKTSENKSQSAASSLSKFQNTGAAFQFVDNRPDAVAQRKLREALTNSARVKQLKANNTGLPDNLKSGIENLSGISMDHVKVHYNSSKPAQLQAHAYAQGNEIHLAAGQEKHLPHEAWHVVQQAQGRVKPTMQMKGNVQVNDNTGLEKEADVMGSKAQAQGVIRSDDSSQLTPHVASSRFSVAQLYRIGYNPNLAGLEVPGGGAAAYNYDTFTRPAGWYENTLDLLFARAANNGRTMQIPQLAITLVQCESAGSWHNINDVQIGHIELWRDYVRDAQPATVREATNAYNDLDNLRLEGPTANASHDFEKGRESEDDDTDLSDDDFIDKSDKGKMDPRARAMLDEYKGDQSSFYK